MSDKRQKNRNESASKAGIGSEASDNAMRGSESLKANSETESLAATEHMLEEVLDKENLKEALQKVLENKGAAGIDGMKVEQLPAYLKVNWKRHRQELLEGRYAPRAVRKVEIPKADGKGKRMLGIPCAIDRFIQTALQQVFQKYWDGTFSQHSFGFRPGKSQHQAVEQAQEYVSSGLRWVVDLDLEKFFDRVNHDVLMSRIAKRVKDKRVLKLVRAYLNAGMMEDGLVKPTEEGVPQGGPLSPILSNLLLDDLDKELEKRGLRFVRFADDCNIYVASKRAGERVMQSITEFLSKRLRLKVNEEKSAVGRPWLRKFLGFTFTNQKLSRRRIAPASLKRVKDKIRRLTSRKRGNSLRQIMEELTKYLRGWLGYFRHCQTPSVLAELEMWLRRKLRCLVWKRWKRGATRFKRLRAMGLSLNQARKGAGNGSHGPWRMSKTPALHIALSNAFFENLGLPTFKCLTSA